MIIVYSWKGTTLAYARILADLRQESLFELKESKKRNVAGCIFDSLLRREKQPVGMPDMSAIPDSEEITLCSPIWAGQIAAPIRYFFRRGGLQERKVNFLYTCLRMEQRNVYENMIRRLIVAAGGEPGFVMVMAGMVKDKIDEEIAHDHMKRILDEETVEAR